MKLVKSNYYCSYPYLTKRVQVDSAKECATLCVETEGCYYFNVNECQDQLVTCDLTSVHAPADYRYSIDNVTGWNYYSIL